MHLPTEFTTRHPNELGRIPIIMYHSVDNTRSFDKHGLNVSESTFRKHLSMLYDYGMYPINMRDIRTLNDQVIVPKGNIPVVLTFDDGRRSQFQMKVNRTPDIHSAVGIFEDFIRSNAPEWQHRASFYVMPKSSHNLEPFQQNGLSSAKLAYLVSSGYEIGNHTWSHRSLRRMTSKQVSSELIRCFYGIRLICPTATMDTLCIPFGEYPRFTHWRSVLANPLNQLSDMHKFVLMAWGGPSYSPFDKRFDRLRVTRIGVSPNELESTLRTLVKKQSFYVSGGVKGVVHVPAKLRPFVSESIVNRFDLVIK